MLNISRGKGKDGDWEYGYAVTYKPYTLDGELIYGIVPTDAIALYAVEVDRDTIGLGTGIPDKNGAPIFEGDLVQIITPNIGEEDNPFQVEYDENVGAFTFISDTLCITFDNFFSHEAEVVGNIYDNPELIRG